MYSQKPPSVSMPISFKLVHAGKCPFKQAGHLPHQIMGSGATLSPTFQPVTPSPTSATTPPNSCPVNITFEAVGHPEDIDGGVNPVTGCIRSIMGGGKVCLLGLAAEPTSVVFRELIWKEGTLVTSRVSHGEFAEVIEHLKNERLKPEALISKTLHGSETQKGFEILKENPAENIKILLDFKL